MNLKNFWTVLAILSFGSVIFYSGYMVGYRNYENTQNINVQNFGPNESTENSLTSIQTKNIFGQDRGVRKSFGTLYYKVVEDGTDILIKVENIPDNFAQKTGSNKVIIPDRLKVQILTISQDSIRWDREDVGVLILDPKDEQGLRDGQISIKLPKSLNNGDFQVDKIIFEPETINSGDFRFRLLTKEQDPSIPLAESGTVAPILEVDF